MIPKGTRADHTQLKNILLMSLGVAGIVSIAILAPNALQMLDLVRGKKRYQSKAYILTALQRLERRGLIKKVSKNGNIFYEISRTGRLEYERIALLGNLKRPVTWDRIWRIVIFDIRENRRPVRDKVRLDLVTFGFYRLQDSVWVTPFPCEEIVQLLKKNYALARDLLVLECSKIENDKHLIQHFEL